RKEIGVPLDRTNRNNHNENYKKLFGVVNDVVGTITDEVYEQIIDGSKLNWETPVDSKEDLPSTANEGDTRMTRDSGKVYRYNGSEWREIQQIDAGPVNELDDRLTQQLADNDQQRFFESMVNRKKKQKGMITLIDDDGNKGIYTKLRPLALEYGITFTSALATGFDRG